MIGAISELGHPDRRNESTRRRSLTAIAGKVLFFAKRAETRHMDVLTDQAAALQRVRVGLPQVKVLFPRPG